MTQQREDEALIRVGDTSVLLTWEGEKRARKIVARIVREIPPETLKRYPEAAETWTMEELIALGTVIKKAEKHATSSQSTNLRLAAALQKQEQKALERAKLPPFPGGEGK